MRNAAFAVIQNALAISDLELDQLGEFNLESTKIYFLSARGKPRALTISSSYSLILM